MEKSFLLIGGDNRLNYLYQSIKNKGFIVSHIYSKRFEDCEKALEKIENANIIILPIPLTQDKRHIFTPLCDKRLLIEEVVKRAKANTIIFGGGEHILFENNKNYINILLNEEMTLKNAYATAEATLAIIEEKSPTTIRGSNFSILGYGRIGKALGHILKLLGPNVTVFARRAEVLKEAVNDGLMAHNISQINEYLKNSDIIINTIPHLVLTDKELKLLNNETVIIDLASRPGGVDFIAARKYGLNTIHALSLPGKFSPKSAAEYIEEAIFKNLNF